MTEHDTPETACPCCGAVHNAATGLCDDEPPRDGDVTVCIRCASPLIFTADLRLRKPTMAERECLYTNSDVARAIEAVEATSRFAREAKAFRQRYGVDIRGLPEDAQRLLSQDHMSATQMVYVAEQIAKLRRERMT